MMWLFAVATVNEAAKVAADWAKTSRTVDATEATEAIRAVVETVKYRPDEGDEFRVLIVEHADALSPGALNALRKTAEEPPPYTRIILVGTPPDVVRHLCWARSPRLLPESIFRALTRHTSALADLVRTDYTSAAAERKAAEAERDLTDEILSAIDGARDERASP